MAQQIKDQPKLSQTEWQAVAVAIRDADNRRHGAARAVHEPEGRIASALRWLIGIEAPKPLADPRLDAVRRFVWAARSHGRNALELAPELMRFGYSPAQIEALRLVAA
ncbi:MAG: hypothetical protein JWO65_942 [Sphingomonas bacterium]|jgi:hypothetical protein|nr:hypothetical protein [Sphingomonas bacterium]